MKVKIEERRPKVEERVYPYYGLHPNNSIILFTSPKTGTYIGSNMYKGYDGNTGEHSPSWNEDEFTVLKNCDIIIKV